MFLYHILRQNFSLKMATKGNRNMKFANFVMYKIHIFSCALVGSISAWRRSAWYCFRMFHKHKGMPSKKLQLLCPVTCYCTQWDVYIAVIGLAAPPPSACLSQCLLLISRQN